MINITLIGFVGREPTLSKNGDSYSFTVGVEEFNKNINWFTVWSDNLKIKDFITKGKSVGVSGRLYFSETKTGKNVGKTQNNVDSSAIHLIRTPKPSGDVIATLKTEITGDKPVITAIQNPKEDLPF